MIKTRNDSRSALRGELVAVGMKWKSMRLSDLMKCEIKYIEVTRHFHLVVSALANTSRQRNVKRKTNTGAREDRLAAPPKGRKGLHS